MWGLYFGFFVIIEKRFLLQSLGRRPAFVGHVYTLLVVMIGWVLFEMEHLASAWRFIGVMLGFSGHGFADQQALYVLSTNIVLFVVLAICATPLPGKILSRMKEQSSIAGVITVPLIYFLFMVLSTAYLVNETYNPFLYFRF